MRRTISLLVVLMMAMGPFAQGVDLGDVPTLTPPEELEFETPTIEPTPDASELLSNIDGFFTENLGQKGERAGLFYCEGSPLSVAFDVGFVSYYYLPSDSDVGASVQVRFEGSNAVEPIGVGPMQHLGNFFIGNDPDMWVTGARSYREVLYNDLYDGIDLVYRFSEGRLKYDYIVEPHADPGQITMGYQGVEGLELDAWDGDLLMRTAAGTLRDEHPVAFQEGPDRRSRIEISYEILGSDLLGFDIGRYDPAHPLVIDPGMDFSTYIGGSNDEYDRIGSVVHNGSVVVAGVTYSSDFPITPGAYDTSKSGNSDIFITRLNQNGSDLVFSTFLGDSSSEAFGGIAIDAEGEIFVTGNTNSTNFPVTPGAIQSQLNGKWDVFILKMVSNGSALVFSTLLGGDDWELTNDIALGHASDVYVYGSTRSSDFPVVSGCYDTTANGGEDLFVSRTDRNGTKLLASTYLGGSSSDWFNRRVDLRVDDDSNVYVASHSSSDDFPTTSGAYCTTKPVGAGSGTLTKMDANLGKLIFSTYIGGPNLDWIDDVVIGADGNIYVCGSTWSADFPLTQGAYRTSFEGPSEGFIAKLNASGDKLLYGTFFGGNDQDMVFRLRMDGECVNIAGRTTSDSFPTTPDCYDDTYNGEIDSFIARLNLTDSTLEYGTYLGGSDDDYTGGFVDNGIYSVIVGVSASTNYPTTANAYQRNLKGSRDIFVSQLVVRPVHGTRPSEPLNLTAELEDDQVELSWEPPIVQGDYGLRGYRVLRGLTPDSMDLISEVGGDAVSYFDAGLSTGIAYYYGLKALNWIGESNLSNVVNVTFYGLPWPPQRFEAFPGDGNVTLKWEPPSNTGGLPLAGYAIMRGPDVYEMERICVTGPVTSYIDEGLVNGEEYTYAISAVNSVGEGDPAFLVGPVIPFGPPTAPRYLTVDAGDSQATLEWRPPENDGGRSILEYGIFRGLTEQSMELFTTVSDFITTWTDTDLTNGVTYHYAVLACNEVGDGPLCQVVAATPAGHPGAPTAVTVEAGDGYVHLEWGPPGDTGGFPIERYLVYRGTSEINLAHHANVVGGETSYNDTDLENGVTLYYIIRADNGHHLGLNTTAIKARPLALPGPPRNLNAVGNDRSVTLTWDRPADDGGADISNYSIVRGTSADDMEVLFDADPTSSRYLDFDVVPGTTYHYAVCAISEAGVGQASHVVQATPYGPPGPPTNVRIEVGTKEIAIMWEPPEDDGASRITGYVIERGLSVDSLRKIAEIGLVTSFLDTSVSYGQRYHYTVSAVNEAGVGESSEMVAGTSVEPPSTPSEVPELDVELDGRTVTLQWTAPLDDGGSPLTGYVILRGLSKDSLEQVAEVGPSVTTWSEGGLERGTTYYYSVYAKNAVGNGDPIAVREMLVPEPKKDDSPGLEVIAVLVAFILIVPVARRRRTL